jgi:hypothetical protein
MTPPPLRHPHFGRVCAACRDLQWRWLDTRPQDLHLGLGYVTQASAAYDLTAAGSVERRRARWQRWRDLVVDQIAGIADGCHDCNVADCGATPAARGGAA